MRRFVQKYAIPLYCFIIMVHMAACIMLFENDIPVSQVLFGLLMGACLAAMVAIGQAMCPKPFFSRKVRGFMLAHTVTLWLTMVMAAHHFNQAVELIGIFGMFASVFFVYRSLYHAMKQVEADKNESKAV